MDKILLAVPRARGLNPIGVNDLRTFLVEYSMFSDARSGGLLLNSVLSPGLELLKTLLCIFLLLRLHIRLIEMQAQLPTRKLGKNGPEVTALGLGLMGISAFYGAPQPDSDRFAVLDRAYELGQTNWDSADIYADSEELVGKWFARTGKRAEIFIATKFANKRSGEGNTLKMSVDSSPEYAKVACERSLKRLGIKTIDLYYCHRVDKKTPIEKTVEAMVELKKWVLSGFD